MKVTRTIKHPQLQETVHLATAANGLQVALIPTPGFHTAAAHFGLRFGGNDLKFIMPGDHECEVPTGSAHYLEHKLFEGREEKVFDRFNRLGADFNGGTSFCTTTYYFSTANNFDECLEVLVDFVQYPLITDERVDKERGIIEQEVRMYQDSPGYRGTFLLHEAMYETHAVRVGPGGTLADVARINATDLQHCYDGFYVPQAMRLVLAGDFDVDDVLKKLQPLLRDDNPASAKRVSGDATSARATDWLEEEFAVTRPHVFIGYPQKKMRVDGQDRLHQRIVASLVIDLMFGKSSELRQKLYEAEIVDDSFGAYWSSDESWGHVIMSGVCDAPKSFVADISGECKEFIANKIKSEDFERLRKAAWGGIVSGLQTPSAIASSVLSSMLSGNEIFSALDELQSISLDELQSAAEDMFDESKRAVAVLMPLKSD
jgi:predicted Zn-dependent peptidase